MTLPAEYPKHAHTGPTGVAVAPDPLLSMIAVTKVFSGQTALDRVSLSIDRASIHGLVGANGSGKSTLIKILTGVLRADRGTAAFEGVEFDLAGSGSHALPVRCVHQDRGLIDDLDVVDNVALGDMYVRSRARLIDWPGQATRTRSLLHRVGVGDIDVRTPVGQLDELTRTRIALARAIGSAEAGPGLVVLDEPTANMSRESAAGLFDLVRAMQSAGQSILYVSHNLEEVLDLCDTVSVLREGRMVHHGPSAELTKQSTVQHMLGHEVKQIDRRRAVDTAESGDVVLAVTAFKAVKPSTVVGNSISFSLGRGEIVGLAGVVGAGQDDVPLGLVGSIQAMGTVRTGGQDVDLASMTPALAREMKMSVVPPHRKRQGIVGGLSVRDNITLGVLPRFRRRLGLIDDRAASRWALDWIGQVGLLPPRPDRLVGLLSGGNQQKAVIARCLSSAPEVLLLAEPTAGVDIGAREQIWAIIRQQAREGLAVLVTSSDVADLAAMCTRVLVVRDGAIVAQIHGSDVSEQHLSVAIQADDHGSSRRSAGAVDGEPHHDNR